MTTYDPSATASHAIGIFGIPTQFEKSKIIIIPVPWEVTTSYGGGTSKGPEAIWVASPQIDLFDLELGQSFEQGYHLLEIPKHLLDLNNDLREKALHVREALETNGELNQKQKALQTEINAGCQKMSEWVYKQSQNILKLGKIPVVLGGDHSSPEGNIRAVSEAYNGEIGVLHIDAHADLRVAYQGFERSHASIMYNVMSAKWKPTQLVQVGIRDFSQEEYALTQERPDIDTFFDLSLKKSLFEGQSWKDICHKIIAKLPRNVYVSFDIDGLSPEFCPNTGTPVPGGLSFDQANYLLGQLAAANKQIVGFDLNEVAPGQDEWDGNVGARILYKMCGWAVLSSSQPK